MLKFIINDILALLIDREWRDEALCDMWDLHERMIREGKNKYLASLITLIRVVSIIIYMPISIQSILSSCKKKIVDTFGMFVSSAEFCLKKGYNNDSEKGVEIVDYLTTIDIRNFFLEPRKKKDVNANFTDIADKLNTHIVDKLNEGCYSVVNGFFEGNMKFVDYKDVERSPVMLHA